MQQVQINLLSNTAKYTRRGGRVTLRVCREATGAISRVTDNGAGIPPQLLDSVFDLFVQADHTRDHSNGGLGVGLTLARALVEMHGGTISARSDGDGAGSEFSVRLPVTTPSEPQIPDAASGSTPSSGTAVVVVEDNADSREMLCTMLTHAGLSCHGAADGPAGLQLIEEIAPDVVILDIGLPGLDGLEVARRIRENPRHRGVRLIALTGYGQTRDRASTAAAGFDYHLVKPVQPGELLGLIARLQMSFASSSDDAGAVSPSGA